jgi:hypothetical protein
MMQMQKNPPERNPSDWDRQRTVSFRRKPESITTGGGGIDAIPSPSASMDPGLRRDDNEMVRRDLSPDRDALS